MAETIPAAKLMASPVLLSRRLTFCLSAGTLLLAALSVWGLAAPESLLPMAGLISAGTLPLWIAEMALIITVLIAPFAFEIECAPAAPRWLLMQCMFGALWQGVTLGFFLMVAARIAPLDGQRILLAALYLSLVSLCVLLLGIVSRRLFAGLTFLWCVAIPVSTYFLAEVFLNSPNGSRGWKESSGAAAEAIRGASHWLLSLSPPTALAGSLSGTLADGSVYASTLPFIALVFLSAGLAILALRPAIRGEIQGN